MHNEHSANNSKCHISVAVANPCESQACPEGQRCTVVYHPGFLAIPLAHCVYEDESQDNRQNGKNVDF